MKTYYFSCYYEYPWECGDGCCSGGGEWVINFVKFTDEQGNISDGCSRNFGTTWNKPDALAQVYDFEFDEYTPDFVWEKLYTWEDQEKWLEASLLKKDVVVVFEMEEN